MKTKYAAKKRISKKRIAVILLCAFLTMIILPSAVLADEAVHLEAEGEAAMEPSEVETTETENTKAENENSAEDVSETNEILGEEAPEEDKAVLDLTEAPIAAPKEMIIQADQDDGENSAGEETEEDADIQNEPVVLADETDTIATSTNQAQDRIDAAIDAMTASPAPEIPISVYAQGKDASEETIDQIWKSAIEFAQQRLTALQDKYKAEEDNADECAVDVYIETDLDMTKLESDEPTGDGDFPNKYMVQFFCPVNDQDDPKQNGIGSGFYLTFNYSHSVNSQADAEAVYKKIKEQLENAQITVPASEEISHAEVENYIRQRLGDALTAYGVTADIVSLTADKADLTNQPGTIHYTTEISIPFSNSDNKYQGPAINGTALLENILTRPEATFQTASNEQIGTLVSGKTTSDLIDGEITYTPDSDNPTTIKLTGTLLPNVWTHFSDNESLQAGYYLPITITPNLEGAGLEYRSADAALGTDNLTAGKTLVVYITHNAKSPINITVIEFLDEFQKETTYTLDLSGLTLIPFPEHLAASHPAAQAIATAQSAQAAQSVQASQSVQTPQPPSATKAGKSPKTGDTAADMMTLLIIAASCGALIAFLSVKRPGAKTK